MEQETHKDYHRNGSSVRRFFGQELPSADAVSHWPADKAAYHIRDTIERMTTLLEGVRARGRKGNWLYDPNQQLALCQMIRGERELLHQIIHSEGRHENS